MKVESVNSGGTVTGTIGEYVYDGDGKRIKKIVPSTVAPFNDEVTVFVYDAAGKLVAEYATEISQDPKVSYTTADHLASPRILTDENGVTISRRDFHPFGEEIQTNHRHAELGYTPDDVRQKFTTYERDGEADLDYAQARYYAKNIGRFNSADEPLLDQWEDEPQSWNLYLYVRNNPLNLVDPLGQSAGCPDGSCFKPCPDGKDCTYDDEGNITHMEDGPIIKVTTREKDPNPFRDFFKGFQRVAEPMQPIVEAITPAAGPGGVVIKGGMWIFKGGKWAYGALKLGSKARRSLPVLQKICFIAGTPVLTKAGLKPIEEIREGDEVLSYNEKTKQNEYKKVVRTFERIAEAGRILSVKVRGEAAPLGVTHEHPFYVRIHRARDNTSSGDDGGEWIEAGALRVGDDIRKADGTWARVESIIQRNEGAKVYNFEVADNHNYFVGGTGLLAHNQCIVNLTRAGKRAIGNLAKHKDELVRDVQRARGGKAGAWNAIDTIEDGVDYSNVTLGEVANAAARGVGAAERVLKQVKDAARLAGNN